MNALDRRLLTAHERNDTAQLSALYTEAANEADDVDATAFFLTHAYVFALDAGLQNANALQDRLIGMGRDRRT
ncbi:MAG: hypothetical protein ABJ360_10740 [Roseobacter sp.]